MPRRKPFIEKGEGVKFYLVHRSQKDPMYLDENVGERVLVPADEGTSRELVAAVNGLSLTSMTGAKNSSQAEREEKRHKRREEQHKFGIYYEDDYDYLQHLREPDSEEAVEMMKKEKKEPHVTRIGNVLIKEDDEDDNEEDQVVEEKKTDKPKLQLPSSVFASQFEVDVGYFNQAAPNNDPKINWDPDVVKILDEDPEINFDDPENEIEDDFFLQMNSDKAPEKKKNKIRKKKITESDDNDEENESEDDEDDDEDYDDEDDDEDSNCRFGSGDGEDDEESESLRDFETKTKFSSYSMSSSVIKRNEHLTTLDTHFENFFSQYSDDQIGALDEEDIDGYRGVNNEVLEQALAEFTKMTTKEMYVPEKRSTTKKEGTLEDLAEEEDGDEDEDTVEGGDSDSDDDNEASSGEDTSPQNKNLKKEDYEWLKLEQKKHREDRLDCESIISTYSTLYNHPTVITERHQHIKLSAKTGLPLGVLNEKPMSKNLMDRIDHKITRVLPEIGVRTPDETKEEKKARKQAVKEHRRERRVEKKINTLAFKTESTRQKSQLAGMKEGSHSIKLT